MKAYVPALDGLRGLGVLGVMLYHLDTSASPWGLLGVDVFFVLSGFLITSLLLAEHRATGRFDLRRFYVRRALRLFPASYAVLAVHSLALLLLGTRALSTLLAQDALAMLGLANFLWFSPLPVDGLGHLWTLAIEQQFYLVWPFTLGLLLRHRIGRPVLALGLLAPLVYFLPVTWPQFIASHYLRGSALLVGCSTAMVLSRSSPPPRAIRLLAFGLALVALPLLPFTRAGDPLYVLLLWTVAATIAVATCCPTRPLDRTLGSAALVWIGKRSYGVYLWHWTTWFLLAPLLPTDSPILSAAFRVAIALGIAGLSYRFLETPFLRRKSRISAPAFTPPPAAAALGEQQPAS